MKHKFLPWLAIIFVQFQFSLLPTTQKILLRTLAPGELMTARIVLSAILFGLFYRLGRKAHHSSSENSLSRPPEILPWYLPVLGVVANQGLLIVGISLAGAAIAAIMAPCITLFTYAFALAAGQEKWSQRRGFALSLGAGAVCLLALNQHRQTPITGSVASSNAQILGVLCILASTACYGGFLVVSRRFMLLFAGQSLPYTTTLFRQAAWLSLPLALLLGRSNPAFSLQPLASPDQLFWFALAFAVVGATALNYFLTSWSLLRLPASSVSGLICLQAMMGSAWSVIFLGEKLTVVHGISAAMVCISVLLLH
jgi:drug/metabolite transporter (DMT)-like permease